MARAGPRLERIDTDSPIGLDTDTFFAHSGLATDRSDWQPLSEHLRAVGNLAADFASSFGASELGRVAGTLHDLGKYTAKFQRRLDGDIGRVDHSTWGARVAIDRYGPIGRLIAYAIAGHHAGLANGRDPGTRSSLNDRLRTDLPLLLNAWTREIELPAGTSLPAPDGFRPRPARGQFQLSLLARMLFSALVDADFLDTEAYYDRIQGRSGRREAERPALADIRASLDQTMATFRPDTHVNQARADILMHVRARADLEPGLFSLTVPTGGGKTLASLAFALDHAIAHGLRRIIFVIPFTSVVEQNAAAFRWALGDLGPAAVLEHHSAFIDEPLRDTQTKEEGAQAEGKLRVAMDNWDAPIVVTTAVQFFESLFADRPSRCRKLHRIAKSVVILDEAQTLPVKLLRPAVAALDELALNYRTSIVLCTATQPALQSGEFSESLTNVRELAPEPKQLFERLRRVSVRHAGPLGDAEIVGRLRARDQILCIVNNRRHARALTEAIEDLPGAFHLTTFMCARHRQEVLAAARAQLSSGQPCRLVATSLIEAGVDIDFPAVLRAEAGLDSVAQAAGRCNREGRRLADDSEVLVFTVANEEWAPPPELAQFAQAARAALRRHAGDPTGIDAIEEYFRQLYWQKGPAQLDAYGILEMLENHGLEGMPFETVSAKFRMIESVQMPVVVPYDDGARDALRALEFALRCGNLARRLQPYVVQVPRRAFDALESAGALAPVGRERFGRQFMYLTNMDIYDKRVGLRSENPAFIRSEGLVV